MAFNFNITKPAYPSDLYAGADVSSLNWAERQWVDWYVWWKDPVIATGVMSFLLHELTYFGRCVPWIVIDQIPYFNKWKIQDEKQPSWEEQWRATKYVLWTHFTVELPQIWLFHPIAEYFGLATHQVPFPSATTMFWQILAFFFFEDWFHYVAHRILHHRKLYKHIHKIHHEYSAPFGLAAEYAHPLEVLILGAGTIGGPLCWVLLSNNFPNLFSDAVRNLHIVTVYIWVICKLFQAVDAHSGYDFPWSLQHIFPLWSGADHHDYHHQAFVGCYATSFRIWDHLLGTDKGYKEYRAKQKEARARAVKAGTSSKEEMKRLDEEVRREACKEGQLRESEVVREAGGAREKVE